MDFLSYCWNFQTRSNLAQTRAFQNGLPSGWPLGNSLHQMTPTLCELLKHAAFVAERAYCNGCDISCVCVCCFFLGGGGARVFSLQNCFKFF